MTQPLQPRSTLSPYRMLFRSGTYVVRVETVGSVVTDTSYAEYGDWNWDDYQADILLPRRMTRKQGDTTLDLVTTNTNTYNRSEEHTSELQSPCNLVCRPLLEK